MFTGIVETTLHVASVSDHPAGRRLTLAAPPRDWDLHPGASIAVNGCCLTITKIHPDRQVDFDLISQTIKLTNLRLLHPGDKVNLERPLLANSRIDGHFVQGHIDATADLIKSEQSPAETRLILQIPPQLASTIIPQGSITIDGVSLTIAAVNSTTFEVALIPTTLQRTTLGQKTPGWPFNIEADIIAKTVIRSLERQRSVEPRQPL